MKNILIIYTGGTIGMTKDAETGALSPFDFGKVYDRIPELKRFDCKIDFYSFVPLIDSSDMQPNHWIEMANQIQKNYSDYDGFIILHGTDTMSYTASALSFMLENLNKPVILTGSQLPLEALRTDARSNLITTVEIICNPLNETPSVNEVCIFFDNQLFRGNRTEKFTSSKFDAFRSANYPALAEAGVDIVYHPDAFSEFTSGNLIVHKNLDNNIGLLKLFPGITKKYLDSILNIDGLKGIVLESYGAGNAPTSMEFISAITIAIERGIVIVNVSQCSGGAVDLGKYESSMHLQQAGIISGGDMTTESALTKLMFLFGMGLPNTEVEKLMQTNLRGELTE